MKFIWFVLIFFIVGLLALVAINKNTVSFKQPSSTPQIKIVKHRESTPLYLNTSQIFKPSILDSKCIKTASGLLMSIVVAVFFYITVYFYKIFSI